MADDFISGLEVFCLPLNYLFFFLTIVAHTTNNAEEIHSAKLPQQNFSQGSLLPPSPKHSCH